MSPAKKTKSFTPEVVSAFAKAFALLVLEQEKQEVALGSTPTPRMADGTFDMVYAEEGMTYEGLVSEILAQEGLVEAALPNGSEPPLLKHLRDEGYRFMREAQAKEVVGG